MNVIRFRSKVVEVEAVQFDGKNGSDIQAWTTQREIQAYDGGIMIETLEGPFKASPGDWIVRGLKGEFYPVKPDIMQMKYERVEELAPFLDV